MTFREYLALFEVVSDEQAIQSRRIGTQIYKYIRAAVGPFMDAKFKKGDASAKLLPFIQKVWTPVHKDNVFLVDQQKTGTPYPVMVQIASGGKTYFTWVKHEGQKTGFIRLDISDIEGVQSRADMGHALQASLGKIMHEPVHAQNLADDRMFPKIPDDELKGGNAQAARNFSQAAAKAIDPAEKQRLAQKAFMSGMEYMATVEEIEAYGHQFAMLYHRHFPHQEYDESYMQKLIDKLVKFARGKADVNQNAIHYFVTMRKPSWQNYKNDKGVKIFARATAYMDSIMKSTVHTLLQRN